MGISIGGNHVDNVRECSPPIHHKGIALALNGNKFPSNLQEKLLRGNVSIDLFDYHESSGTFILGIHILHSMTSWGYLASARLRTPSRSSNPLPQYEVSPLVVDLPRTEFSSLQITPNSNIITTTYGGGKVQFCHDSHSLLI
jgi:hypothetical protein